MLFGSLTLALVLRCVSNTSCGATNGTGFNEASMRRLGFLGTVSFKEPVDGFCKTRAESCDGRG